MILVGARIRLPGPQIQPLKQRRTSDTGNDKVEEGDNEWVLQEKGLDWGLRRLASLCVFLLQGTHVNLNFNQIE